MLVIRLIASRSAILGALSIIGLATMAIGQVPQGGSAPPQMTIEMVKPGLYAILNPGSNTLAVRITNDGVLLVDDMFERNYDQIIGLVKSVTAQPVKYVVSTHHHGDHTRADQAGCAEDRVPGEAQD